MKALVKSKPQEGLWLCDVDQPVVGSDDVLVKIEKSAICGTDLHIYNWDEWAQNHIQPPRVIGHEFCGTLIECGENWKQLKRGITVSGEGHVVCGRCRNCMAGRRHLCRDTYGVGIERDGAFAEYLSIPGSNLWLADPAIDKNVLASFDPLGNATHTALSFDLLGEDVLITGAGPIGLMATAICRHAGARHIVVSDLNPYRLTLARKMGATRAINPQDIQLTDVMEKLGMAEGFDVGLEMSGSEQAFNQMVGSMIHGGKIALLGIQGEDTKIDWDKVVFNGLTIKGIYGREMYETWYKMSSMVLSGLDIGPSLTHQFHYTEFKKAFDLMREGLCGKVILNWD
ncbi:MAG: L-threonine 3-dehydrogenase [Bdellovibrionales bacterium]|nr:L-threonine 3-dehydrogenase [Bdellovibrionales bacterium]MBT3524930.1 L-threonine 3-dehydrogenase [Bdellovibrionales bacterium]MBT7767445.1 L-threonine 3-dehydrogenase [Bdellovibrionales bacterium]